MGTECDHNIQLRSSITDLFVDKTEQKVHGSGSGSVRNDQQDAFTGECESIQILRDNRTGFFFRQVVNGVIHCYRYTIFGFDTRLVLFSIGIVVFPLP